MDKYSFAIGIGFFCCFIAAVIAVYFIQAKVQNKFFNQMYFNILSNSLMGLLVFDSKLNCQFVNLVFLSTFTTGATADSCCLNNIVSRTLQKFIKKSCKEISPDSGDYRNLKFKIKDKHYLCNVFAVTCKRNRVIYIFSFRDQTKLVKTESRLKKQLSTAKEYTSSKEEFFANISHELKTPLNAIIGLVHILERTDLNSKQEELVGKIGISSDMLLDIINDLLDSSRMKKMKLMIHKEPFKLEEVFKELDQVFSAQLEHKNIAFLKNIDVPDKLCILGDKVRLKQVLSNLINNAIKFTNTGYIMLSCYTCNETDNKISLRFSVKDSGIGVEADKVESMFEEFSQVASPLTKPHMGTGLGLSICKYLVKEFGGNIEVETCPGRGSEFFFVLNFDKSQMPDEEDYTTPQKFEGKNARVLVAEDTAINYEVVEELLSEVGISCDHANDGLEAIEMCKAAPPGFYKVVLMDIHMPKLDGYSASEVLKKNLHMDIPILALTATTLDEDYKEKYKGIIDGFILKPFKHTALIKALKPYFNDTVVVDKELALSRMDNREDLYKKYITRFKENYVSAYSQIIDALNNEDYSEAHRLAHSVKGIAGTLGLVALHQAAAELETDIRENNKPKSEVLSEFESKLTVSLEADIL